MTKFRGESAMNVMFRVFENLQFYTNEEHTISEWFDKLGNYS